MHDRPVRNSEKFSFVDLLRTRIGKKLVLYILLFSGAVTFILTSMQVYHDYRFELTVIDQKFKQIELTNIEPLEHSVWQLNKNSLQLQLDGLSRVTDIVYLEVIDVDGSILVNSGSQTNKSFQQRIYPLHYHHLDQQQDIGKLRVQITLTGMYERLIDTVVVLLISQGVKTFLVSLFILYIFQILVNRHLISIVDSAQKLENGELQTPIVLAEKRRVTDKPDELDILVDSLDKMRANLGRSFKTINRQKTQLEYEVTHDFITKLPNKLLLNRRINENIENDITQFSLIQFKIKHFKDINDTLGHSNGDLLIQLLVARMNDYLDKDKLLARVSNSEFVILLNDPYNKKDTEIFIRHFTQLVNKPIEVSGISMQLEICAGISIYPQHGNNAEQLLRSVDIALVNALDNGLDLQVYSEEIDFHTPRRLIIMNDLHSAIVREEFLLYYQPQINCRNNSIHGIEALIRWRHPQLEMVPPDEFINVAELSGLIRQLSVWVIKQACIDYSRLAYKKLSPTLSINLSAKNLLSADCNSQILTMLKGFNIPTNKFCVEITENSIMAEPETVIQHLSELKAAGVNISIDDYGTGYSSLSYLRLLPANELKIDRAFITDMHDNLEDKLIVNSTIKLAHQLGLNVIAEGVELEEHISLLKEAGCDHAQGYYIGRPMPFDELLEWMAEWDIGHNV